jgi:hypothetical protein
MKRAPIFKNEQQEVLRFSEGALGHHPQEAVLGRKGSFEVGALASMRQGGVSLDSAADLVLATGPPVGEGRLTGLQAQKSLVLPRPGQCTLSHHKPHNSPYFPHRCKAMTRRTEGGLDNIKEPYLRDSMRYLAFTIGAIPWLGGLHGKSIIWKMGPVDPQKGNSGIPLISAKTPILGPQVTLASGGNSLLLSLGFHRTPSPILGMGGDRCVSEGFVVGVWDVYYGFITISRFLVQLIGAASNATTTSTGPAGLRAEYIFGKVVGLGGDLQLSSYTLSWTTRKYDNILGAYHDYYYKIEWTRIRVMTRVAFYFPVGRAVKPYVATSGGLRIESFSTETNDPSHKVGIPAVGPAGRLALGTRFFFTPDVGGFAEVGVFGGGLFHVGLSFKLK